MNRIIKVDSNVSKDRIRIELFLSDVCNYKCWYCFPGSNDNTHPWPKLDLIVKNLSHVIEYYKTHLNKKSIYLHIIGGEPSLWRDIGEFIKIFKEKYKCIISISTNGSRTLRWWEEYGHYFDQVMISCHHQFVKVPHVIDIANTLYKKNVNLVAMVLMDPNEWDKCISIIEALKTSKYPWPISPVEVNHENSHYTKEHREFIEKNLTIRNTSFWYWLRSNKISWPKPTITFNDGTKKRVTLNWLSLNEQNRFFGWDCNLGIDTFYIHKSGQLQGACGQALYNLDFKYNIFDEDFTEKFHPNITSVTCQQFNCGCQPETNARKTFKKVEFKKVIPLVQL